jgi:YesN/AraC family two-component response regulator
MIRAIKELANLIERSPNYTLSLFKEGVGHTPLEYQHRLRITSAKEMLQNTSLTVTFIAEYLGYYDSSYFYKMFRKYAEQTVSSYANPK